jgi:hypothetical protein
MGSKRTLGRLAGGVEWMHLAQDRDRCRDLVNAVIKLEVWRHGFSWLKTPISIYVVRHSNVGRVIRWTAHM